MMLTEAEAREKWCPFVRVAAAGVSNLWNRPKALARSVDSLEPKMSMCLASSCMAWRFVPEGVNGRPGAVRERGFCGLAGGPTP